MNNYYHTFYIPVMGTGHTADTPIRVAPLGISSVISLVDDLLLEKIRQYYSEKYDLPYIKIPREEKDGRAKRITAYLDAVREIVGIKMEAMKKQPFFVLNDKRKYFELLPDESFLKKAYIKLLKMSAGSEREALEKDLTHKMRPGSIDVNIMVKLDRMNFNGNGQPLPDEFSDAKTALRGYAESSLSSGIVLSAGMNQSLFNYMTRFRDFYRNKWGEIKKKIIIKVSDFRSAFIQGKFLARKGLEISEFRIESGLNCGGHAFPSNGSLLPALLRDFKEKREQLAEEFKPFVQKYYRKMGWEYPESASNSRPVITIQGGVGIHAEAFRLQEDFNMDLVGWASSFLLVPEATCVDESTLELLRQAGEGDLYMSDASPLGITFNNLRNSGSELMTRKRMQENKPGSPCPKGFLKTNTEFTERPICLGSRQYQKRKLDEIENLEISDREKEELRAQVVEKSCICDHLGNGALINLGLVKEQDAPQSICPGPNTAWFTKIYTLQEMVDHIYGRGPSLTPPERPHMFAKEIEMYVDYFEKLAARCALTPQEIKAVRQFKDNMEDGMDFCLTIAKRRPYQGENLDSISSFVKSQKMRLQSISADFEKSVRIRDNQ